MGRGKAKKSGFVARVLEHVADIEGRRSAGAGRGPRRKGAAFLKDTDADFGAFVIAKMEETGA
eukprot:8774598-Alexandrium_andersonii.AAC.1